MSNLRVVVESLLELDWLKGQSRTKATVMTFSKFFTALICRVEHSSLTLHSYILRNLGKNRIYNGCPFFTSSFVWQLQSILLIIGF
jgi:hypothetical protein